MHSTEAQPAKKNERHLLLVDLGDVADKVQDTAGVAPLVVIPRHKLDKVVVEADTSLSVEDGGVGVAVQVSGNELVLGVSKNT